MLDLLRGAFWLLAATVLIVLGVLGWCVFRALNQSLAAVEAGINRAFSACFGDW